MVKSIRLKRKNFLTTLIISILLWFALVFLIYFVDPFAFGAIYMFFALVFLCLFFTFSLLFASSRRGLLTSISLTLFLFLRYLELGHILNLLLVAGLAITIELYFARQ